MNKKMFFIGSLSVVSLSVALVNAQDATQPYQNQPAKAIQSTQTATDSLANVQKNDAEVLGYLIALNEAEMNAADEALKRKINGQAKDYAEMMKKDHGENLNQTMEIARQTAVTPAETPGVEKFEADAKAALAKLTAMNDKQFGVHYISAMVRDHSNALQLIDDQLMKQAERPEVKDHLSSTRAKIAEHLSAARKIQNNLKS